MLDLDTHIMTSYLKDRIPQSHPATSRVRTRRWSVHGSDDTSSSALVLYLAATAAVDNQESTTATKRSRRRSVDMSPLPKELKKQPSCPTLKQPSSFSSKFASLKDRLPWSSSHGPELYRSRSHSQLKNRHVHFPTSMDHLNQAIEFTPFTEEEKACYHYTRRELFHMQLDAKKALQHKTRFADQPDNTILEQGYLTLPQEHHFFHRKRYYCLLTAREILCYSSPVHAIKRTHCKERIAIINVQECSSMSMQAKIVAFGANLPPELPYMFFVTKMNGQRVLFEAESKRAKKNWVTTLLKLTQVHEVFHPDSYPPSLSLKSIQNVSSTSTCASEDDECHIPPFNYHNEAPPRDVTEKSRRIE